MVRYLFYTIGDLTYQSPLVVGCHVPRNFVQAHTPAFLVGLLSWAPWNMYVTGTLSFNSLYFNVT